jgi:hypothetical protein
MPALPYPQTYGIGGYGSGLYGNQPIETLPIGYYLSLLTSEYALPNSPKWNAFLYLLLKKFDDVSQCLVQMDTAFDIDFAVGVQLDAVGVIVGQSRTVGFQPSGGVSPVLDDATYRILLKARVAQNQWDGTIGGMQAIWQSLFPSGRIIIADQQNMTADILVTGSFTSIIEDLIVNGYIVPRPEAVLYNFIFPHFPMFGADLDNAFIAGADLGYTT